MTKSFLTSILLLGSVLLFVFYVRPTWQTYQKLHQEYLTIKSVDDRMTKLTEERDKLKRVIESVSPEDLAGINAVLPTGQQSQDLLVLLENLVPQKSLTLKTIQLSGIVESHPTIKMPQPGGGGQASPVGTAKEIPIIFTLTGTYENFKIFMDDLETNARLIDTLSVFLPSVNGNRFDFSVSSKAYHQ